MTKDEAERHAKELGDGDPAHRYFAHPRPEPGDPRETIIRNVPPWGAG